MSVTDGKSLPPPFSVPLDAKVSAHLTALARETLQIEADAILSLIDRLRTDDSHSFPRAVALLLRCSGRVVVSGMGKSGHIARKIASTLSSTGTPALFVHPAEAAHGDLGMITENDAFIAISNSGESDELMSIVPVIKRMGTALIAMTGNPASSLGQLAEASTTAALAMGDALAVALLDARGFREDDFARSHPGGALGRKLLTHVRDIMRSGEAIPAVTADVSLSAALLEITRKGIAVTAVVDENFHLVGVFTDGDLRRLLENVQDFSRIKIADVMHHSPRSVGPDQLAVEAVKVMEQFRINQLLVTDASGKLVGALHIHDLTRAKVI
jgi:arabinose-5-phosphate isomerase